MTLVRKKTTGFLERTISGIIALLLTAVSSEEIALKKGFLQHYDPRFKALSVALLLIAALLAKKVLELGVMYLIALLLALASGIGLWFFLKRTLFFIPVFAFFIVVPAIFNFVTPGTALVSFTCFAHTVSITRQGVDSALIFFMRVLTSVTLAVLLMLTTRHQVLLKVLRIFKIPQLFVMTMGMCYRYIFLLLDIIQKTFVAIKSRVGYVSSPRTGRRIVAANMGALWLRSYRLHTDIYSAMLARGFSGEVQVLDVFHARTADYIFLAAALSALIGILWLNQFLS